jgi:hypothetical protein
MFLSWLADDDEKVDGLACGYTRRHWSENVEAEAGLVVNAANNKKKQSIL